MTHTPTASPRFTRGLGLDFRATFRGLRRRPAFTAAAALTIALAVGATTAMFSIVDAVLLRALPFAQPERLVALMPGQFVSGRDVEQLRERLTSLDQVASFSPGWLMPLIEVDEPRQVNAARISANMLPMLGARPMLGETFGQESEEPGAARVALLSHELWREVFGADPAIVGRSIALEGSRATVVGVMPAGFQLMDTESDLWVPMSLNRTAFTWTGATSFVYGRLRLGRSIADVGAELRTVIPAIVDAFDYGPDWGAQGRVISLQESMVGDVRRMLWLLFGAVVFLLAIATGNVANLLLVRTSERRGEIALRTSLGAPRGRIARLLLGESLLLGAVGGLLGAGLAVLTLRVLPAMLPPDLPRLGEIAVNGRVLFFGLGATLLAAVIFGLAPVVHTWRGTAAGLREHRGGGISGDRMRGALVALQVALALVLMVGASVMARSVASMLRVDRGLKSDHLLTARVMPGLRAPDDVRVFWREALARIRAIPGVTGAATLLHLPTGGRTWYADIEVEGRPTPPDVPKPRAAWQAVSTDYFATAGIPLLAGRPFDDTDRQDAPRVVAVNAAFAARFFPGENAVGRQVSAGNATSRQLATIVAVVGGVRHDSLSAPPAPEVYVPIEQNVVYATGLLVRTTGTPEGLAAAVQQRIWSVNKDVPVTEMRSMDDLFSASLQRPRLILRVLGLLAGVGLLLGAVGIYGVVAFGVQQRRRELGIRAALGADASLLRGHVLRGGLRFTAMGVLVGLPLALAGSRVMRGMVYGVAPADPLSFAVVPAALALVALCASWVPARTAARLDPAVTLRDS